MIRHAVLAIALVLAAPLTAGAYDQSPALDDAVAKGKLPPVDMRLPQEPAVADFTPGFREPGTYGGTMRILFGRAKDIRLMTVYGYARLVGYNHAFDIVPDLLKDVTVTDGGRTFTLHLRPGHKWSDGHPFTAEDFRFFWDDIANNEEVSRTGPPHQLKVKGKLPRFTVIDDHTVRYAWDDPNPLFLPALAKASPLYIYRPAHFMKKFHAAYQNADKLAAMVEEANQRNWVALMLKLSRQYRNDNPKLPTLQPWVNTTNPPAERFIFVRNPYYHRVDTQGRQLPYIDEVAITIASGNLIAAKAGSGEVDLQARSLSFSDYTFLKQGEKRNDFEVRLWRQAKGAHMALFPNMNTQDPVWRSLFRNADFRRALSMAINRREINQVIYFGLAYESNNTVLPTSPLYTEELATTYATFDLDRANALLDGLGLTARNDRGVRLLPDGRPMEIIVETPGEDSEQADVLELIHDTWLEAGLKLYTKPLQREVFRNRVFGGLTQVSVWFGIENAVATANTPPLEMAPVSQHQYQWPQWGQYHETNGEAGEPPALPAAKRLLELEKLWVATADTETRRAIWDEMLSIHADQVFSIGIVNGVLQPIVVARSLKNVPDEGIYNWDPGAHFGAYKPDVFWFDPTVTADAD